jgi:hypothetical protein
VQALQNFDDFLHWTIPRHMRTYALLEPLQTTGFDISLPRGKDFVEWHGYFSAYDPLVGKVSKKKGDKQIAHTLLMQTASSGFATDEVLAKVMAYRDMKVNDQIMVPTREGKLIPYRVDHVFDLWRGMPAFGLIADQNSVPILLFRGTDFSLDSERGWASLMSDVDVAGPGLTAFIKAREEIRAWLMKAAQRGPKARVIGFSLGGSLAAYTYLYENSWVNLEGCIAFNPPGFSDQIFKEWDTLSEEKKKGFRVYVNRGDVVSKIGKLFGDAYELSLEQPVKPLKAHTLLLSAESPFFLAKIDVEKENLAR